jgi:hypothetical protein
LEKVGSKVQKGNGKWTFLKMSKNEKGEILYEKIVICDHN